MNNRNSRILKRALLFLVPFVIFAFMRPVARERRKIALTQQLIRAAQTQRSVEVIRQLVLQGADVNGKVRDSDLDLDVLSKGNTALHYCVRSGDDGMHEQIKFLLEHGADVDAQNELGQTPLILAANVGHYEAVEMLIRQGAKVNLKTKPTFNYFNANDKLMKRWTALGVAESYDGTKNTASVKLPLRMKQTIKILEAAGAKE